MEINSLMGLSESVLRKAESSYQQGEGKFREILEKAQNAQNASKEQDDEQLKTACREIEALFIQQMLKQMRATIPKAGLIPESMATNIYQEMLDSEYSKLMSESHNSLGIAKMLYKQLKPDPSIR